MPQPGPNATTELRYEVIQFNSIDIVIGKLCLDVQLDRTFISLLEFIDEHHHAKSIIVEHNYIDMDYTNEFSKFYAKTFNTRRGYCKRLHFFSHQFESIDDFINSLQAAKTNTIAELSIAFGYVGFIVKRPLHVGKVGRTILKPAADLPGSYYLCLISRHIHILGYTLAVTGIPFIEQDAMVITCAQASIWMAAKYMHLTHSLKRHLPYDITELAANIFPHTGRSIPSDGLTLEQMNVVLTNMGYFPLLHYKPSAIHYSPEEQHKYQIDRGRWSPLDKIYPYIESQIPVIVIFPGHASVVVGHNMYPDNHKIDLSAQLEKLTTHEEKMRSINPSYNHPAIISTSIFINAFIMHDDQQGAYRMLPVDISSFNFMKTSAFNNLLPIQRINVFGESEYAYKSLDDVQAVIVPLPDKIYLLAEHVVDISKRLLKEFAPILIARADKGYKLAEELLCSMDLEHNDPIVIRPYFIRSSEYKSRIAKADPLAMDSNIKNCYMQLEMPKFIWCVEISTYSIYKSGNKICGEILFDSTGNRFDPDGVILSVHLPGFFCRKRHLLTPEKIYDNISSETPYSIVSRCNIEVCNTAI